MSKHICTKDGYIQEVLTLSEAADRMVLHHGLANALLALADQAKLAGYSNIGDELVRHAAYVAAFEAERNKC